MRVVILPAAERDVGRLAPEAAERVLRALRTLRDDPRPPGSYLLRNWSPSTWRIRVGAWRVLYRIDDDVAVVTVVRVRHRSSAY